MTTFVLGFVAGGAALAGVGAVIGTVIACRWIRDWPF